MTAQSSTHFGHLAALRAEVRALECGGRGKSKTGLPFGIDTIDARLADGGLAAGALHEVTGASPDLADDAAATLFAAALAARCAADGGTVLWALGRRDLFAPGLAQAGLSPDRLLQAECGRDEEVLAVMEEVCATVASPRWWGTCPAPRWRPPAACSSPPRKAESWR